jgi:multidrug efflux pump subunit AcrB
MLGGDNNIFTQIGLIVLVGLASKNGVLIVKFARELKFQGRSVIEAAVEASRLRLRPILMTSIAFIAGVIPLVIASGTGAEIAPRHGHRRALRHARCDLLRSGHDAGVLRHAPRAHRQSAAHAS